MNNIYKILVLSLCCFNVQAAGRLYKIELVIFAQNMPNSEVFSQRKSKIVWPNKVANRSAYQQVNTQYLSLKNSTAQLARTKGYEPLMHVAWVQSVSANSYSRAVRIKNPEGTINGFFRLQRGSLVHMVADIEYSPRSIIYRLNEKRRFKFNETHYFDHPKFGILARVSLID